MLSVADNLAESCASDKGRSKDPALNSLLRRSAGLQLASGISWRRRHVESRRTPTDQGSRVADRGGLAPGELLRRTRPQVRRGYAVARSAAARARGLPHALPTSPLRCAFLLRNSYGPILLPHWRLRLFLAITRRLGRYWLLATVPCRTRPTMLRGGHTR